MSKGGFTLRKFSANHHGFLERILPELKETQGPISLDSNDGVKTLGLLWNPTTAQFSIAHMAPAGSSDAVATKQKVASVIAVTFDPLGLFSPLVITCKELLQQLWLANLGWDDKLPENLQSKWQQLLSSLRQMNDIRIDRLVIPHQGPVNIQLHGFCDTSEYAYGACLYIRSTDQQHHILSRLLCSKSRVAPVKRVTLPRLELCGAVLLAKLVKKTVPILGIPIHSIHLFTDSTIVLAWIKAASTRWKTFVANRISQIQELTDTECWKHIPTHDNPTDLISRGVQPSTLLQASYGGKAQSGSKTKQNFGRQICLEGFLKTYQKRDQFAHS